MNKRVAETPFKEAVHSGIPFRTISQSPSQTFLAVHGMWASAKSYDPLSKELHDLGDQVYAMDLPGHGFTDHRGHGIGGYSLSEYAAEFAKAYDALSQNAKHPAVIAHSLGKEVVLQYLREGGELENVYLLSPVPHNQALPTTFRLFARHPTEMLRTVVGRDLTQLVRNETIAENLLFSDQDHSIDIGTVSGPSSFRAYIDLLVREAMSPMDQGQYTVLRQRTKALHVIAGDQDRMFSWQNSQDFASNIGAHFQCIEGGSHYVHAGEHRTEVAKYIHESAKQRS